MRGRPGSGGLCGGSLRCLAGQLSEDPPVGPGQPTEVKVTYPLTYDIPLFGSATITLASTAVMQCGG